MSDLEQYKNLTFTTEPKTRRHLTRGAFISKARLEEFMKHLWEVGLRKSCRYTVLVFEFIRFFGTNDKRTVERYLGRPEQTVRSTGSNIVRQNMQSGNIAQFNYFNVRKISAKKGLIEDLGYASQIKEDASQIKEDGETRFLLNHEKMSYYTQQTALETGNDFPEVKEEAVSSNDEMCVSSLSAKESEIAFINKGREREKTGFEGCLTASIEVEKKEEVIDSTHANQSSKSEIQQLCPEMLILLKAKPLGSEPDKRQRS